MGDLDEGEEGSCVGRGWFLFQQLVWNGAHIPHVTGVFMATRRVVTREFESHSRKVLRSRQLPHIGIRGPAHTHTQLVYILPHIGIWGPAHTHTQLVYILPHIGLRGPAHTHTHTVIYTSTHRAPGPCTHTHTVSIYTSTHRAPGPCTHTHTHTHSIYTVAHVEGVS